MLVLIPIVLLVTGASVFSANAEKVYSASSSLFISIQQGDSPSDLVQGSTYAQNQMLSFAQLATMPVVLEPVIRELGLETTARELARRVEVETPRDTVLLEVTVTGSSPDDVSVIANAVAAQLSSVVADIAPENEAGESAVQATVVKPAVAPEEPVAPNPRRNVLAALMAGILLGIVVAYLRETLDTRIRNAADLDRAVGVPVLASVVRGSRKHGVSSRAVGVMQEEEFSRLRVNLQTVGLDDVTKCFVFSSASADEGKTYLCSRTAAAMAAAGSRVLLIDADLRRPTVADHFSLEGSIGLTEVVAGLVRAEDAIQAVQDNLSVLPSGSVPGNPGELLSSQSFATFLAAARTTYDVVLIDSPPILPVADAMVLAAQATGVVLVVDVTKATGPQVHEAVQDIQLGGGRVVGAVLNRTQRAAPVDPYVAASVRNGRRGWERPDARGLELGRPRESASQPA